MSITEVGVVVEQRRFGQAADGVGDAGPVGFGNAAGAWHPAV
jgi:hypothetical protein